MDPELAGEYFKALQLQVKELGAINDYLNKKEADIVAMYKIVLQI